MAEIGILNPAEIAALGRHSVSGRITAVWAGGNALLQTAEGTIHGLTFAAGKPPACGTAVEAVGFPESDLFRINLTRATWSPVALPPPSADDPPARVIRARNLVTDSRGRPRYSRHNHGKLVSVAGELISMADDSNGFGRIFVRADGLVFPVELSGETLARAASIPLGSQIKVTGVCVLDTDGWKPNSVLPQIRGFRLVTRTPADIPVLATPPFWTPGKLFAVIGVLLGALAAIAFWNRTLRRTAERRGRELAQASLARLSSELKVSERTHLAVELHDTLSQAVTGACLEVNAAQVLLRSDIPAATNYLAHAAKTLTSCRSELRNCLWDLRSRALEEPDMNAAIRKTLEPYVGDDTDLAIRFNVLRQNLPDTTAHALMRIVRELVLNALRHGHARAIAVAGCLEGDRLLFSVRDDGCGFDPASAPGSAEGHFGLAGIRERIREMDGRIEIESSPGAGCRVSISVLRNERETSET